MTRWLLFPVVGLGFVCGRMVDDGWFRVLLAIAVAWVLLRSFPASTRPARSRPRRATILLLLAVLSAAQATGPELWQFTTSSWVRVWNVYHYYLGSKYFAELGYHDLYAATLAADRDGYWREVSLVRDLDTYDLRPRTTIVGRYQPRDHFSDERWASFQRDVEALREQRPPDRWKDIFRDRGYNPPPTWTAIGGFFARLDASNLFALKFLCSLDLLILGWTFWLIRRTFGTRAFALTLLLFTMSPVNEGRIVGGFLQFDWFAALAIGLCQLRRQKPVTAGLAFAYAVSTRVFPAILLAAAAVPVIMAWIRRGRVTPNTLRLGIAIVLFGLSFGAIGTMGGGGIDAWTSFADNIGHHNEEHRFGQQRLGLGHLFTHDIRSLAFDENSSERRELFRRQSDLFHLIGALMLVAWFLAARRRSVGEALLLGLVPLFVLTVSSRYYWGCLALLPLLEAYGTLGRMRVRWLTVGQAVIFGIVALYGQWRPEAFARYSVLGMLLGVLLMAWMTCYLVRELRARRRIEPLRAWHQSRVIVALFFIFVLAVLAWLRLPHPDIPIRDVDESVSALIAANWLDGGVPYRDAIDQRGPVTYAIYAAVFALTERYDMRAIHLTLLLLIWGTTWVTFTLARTASRGRDGTTVGMIAALALAISSFTYRRSQMLAFHTEWPMMVFDALAMLLVLRGLQRRSGRALVVAGACFALGFLSKQPGLFDAGAAALFVLLWQHRRGRLFTMSTIQLATRLAVGFFSVLAIVALYFARAGALGDFLLYYWTYNVEHYTAVVSMADRLRGLNPFAHSRHYCTANPLLFAAATMGTVHALYRWLWRRQVNARLLFALWLLFATFGASYSGRNFGHYFIQILVPASLLTALTLRDLWRACSPRAAARRGVPDLAWALRATLILVSVIGFALPVARFGDEIAGRTLWRERPMHDSRLRLLDAIRTHSRPEEPIFVWGYYPELYMLVPREPASRYSNTNYLTGMLPWENHHAGVDTSEHIVDGGWAILLVELAETKPRLIIDTAIGDHRYYAKYPIRDFPTLQSFLETKYQSLGNVDDERGRPIAGLWIRRDDT